MRSMISKAGLGLLCVLGTPATVLAAEGTYMCAFSDVFECVDVAGCKRVTLDYVNMTPVLKIDFDKKIMTSDDLGRDPTEVELTNMVEQGDVVLVHGIGRNDVSPRSFSAAISTKTGKIHAGISTGDATLALVGDCVDDL
ncbi:MAG TPA: hypothetical protein VFD26_05445 [Methyloceanibacter sp.]|nr:hypothetical protein [Methyloceanibacter sp.]